MNMETLTNPTDIDIDQIRILAEENGDLELSAICQAALGADPHEAEPGTDMFDLIGWSREDAQYVAPRLAMRLPGMSDPRD